MIWVTAIKTLWENLEHLRQFSHTVLVCVKLRVAMRNTATSNLPNVGKIKMRSRVITISMPLNISSVTMLLRYHGGSITKMASLEIEL